MQQSATWGLITTIFLSPSPSHPCAQRAPPPSAGFGAYTQHYPLASIWFCRCLTSVVVVSSLFYLDRPILDGSSLLLCSVLPQNSSGFLQAVLPSSQLSSTDSTWILPLAHCPSFLNYETVQTHMSRLFIPPMPTAFYICRKNFQLSSWLPFYVGYLCIYHDKSNTHRPFI